MRWIPFVPFIVVVALLALVLVTVSQLADGPLTWVFVISLFLLVALLRHPISDVVHGLWMRRSKVVAPGHFIRLDGRYAVEGLVARVGLLRTELQTPFGNMARIPNTVVASSAALNPPS